MAGHESRRVAKRFDGRLAAGSEGAQLLADFLSERDTVAAYYEGREYGKAVGFTDVAMDGIELDARSAMVLHKAAQFDALQANKSAAVQKLDSPVVKPGSSTPMPQQVRDKLSFHKSMKSAKTSQEKARLIENRLAGMF